MKGEKDTHMCELRIESIEQRAKEIWQANHESEDTVIKKREEKRQARKQARNNHFYNGPKLSKSNPDVTPEHVKAFYDFFSRDPSKALPHR